MATAGTIRVSPSYTLGDNVAGWTSRSCRGAVARAPRLLRGAAGGISMAALNLGLMFSFRNPAAWRRPFADVYADQLRLIRDAEQLGYDTIWLTEHHFADDGYSPSLIPIAAAIAAQTERVRIGFN